VVVSGKKGPGCLIQVLWFLLIGWWAGLTLEALGTDRVQGLAYATALHAIVYLPEILPGAILLGLHLAVGKTRRSPKLAHASKPPSKGNETTL
jgi:hypothetical protein